MKTQIALCAAAVVAATAVFSGITHGTANPPVTPRAVSIPVTLNGCWDVTNTLCEACPPMRERVCFTSPSGPYVSCDPKTTSCPDPAQWCATAHISTGPQCPQD
jgi:hypothetical protein